MQCTVTVYNGIKQMKIKERGIVAVQGLGGLGNYEKLSASVSGRAHA